MKKDKTGKRLSLLSAILAAVLVFYAARAYSIQIVNAETYLEQLSGVSTRVAVIEAPRGEILDCYGREIAVNREGYNIVFNSAYFRKSDMNKTIITLIKFLEKSGGEWNDILETDIKAPYGFIGDDTSAKSIRTNLGLANYATAEDCFTQMVKRYSLEGYSKDEQRKIMGVRYSMEVSGFKISTPYTFAEDISAENMTYVLESGFLLDGVTVEIAQFREYADDSFAPHIIGTVGNIPSEDWLTKYKPAGYSMNDKVGISGIEATEEKNLRGTDGEVTYKIDADGNILSSEVTKEAIPGKSVMLTIDKNMQLDAQDNLKKAVQNINSHGGRATGGAVVAVNVNSGSIFLAATYPSYTFEQIKTDYESLNSASAGSPLLNRAFNGIYPAGSALKPAVAVAALEEDCITTGEIINCTRKYTFYKDYQPSCMHYHGNISLNNAISKSCNYYFFEAGRRLGIEKLNTYLEAFGFGQRTGVEITDSLGILSKPDADGKWVGGDTLRVSIGQMNAYTPVQLASYTATIANGGTRYKTTLVEKVMTYDMSTEISRNEAEIISEIDISKETLDAVKRGMLSVTEDGTGSATFSNYPIKVGGKTGTAQTTGADHSVFIAFAPFDNPEIAVAIIIEHGASSSATTSTVKAVLDEYFYTSAEKYSDDKPNTLLD